jgi:hypothetical protein
MFAVDRGAFDGAQKGINATGNVVTVVHFKVREALKLGKVVRDLMIV